MNKRERIAGKIAKVPDNNIDELEKYIDKLLSNNNQIGKLTRIEKLLRKLKQKSAIENNDFIELTRCFEDEWDTIKDRSILTDYFIQIMSEFKNPKSEPFAAKRIKFDSRTGGFFEDNFSSILKSYLFSKPDLWSKNNYFQEIDILVNVPIAVPGERNKKQPDILI